MFLQPRYGARSRLRIAQVSPLYESVPPRNYGGTERVVSYLTEELVRMGHEVTLFASGDSVTRAELIPCCPRSVRTDTACLDMLCPHLLMIERVYQEASRFDVIHFHIDYLHFPVSRRQPRVHLTTLHGRLDIPELGPLYDEFCDMPVASISNAQRGPLPQANWAGTVYHGLPLDLHTYRPRRSPGEYLAFLGRISPEKGPDEAIAIARRAGIPLKIAAKVDAKDRDYYEERIRPLIEKAGPLVEFVGEIGGRDKDEFLGNALALLFPINWPEPFGLVTIEALACGTPVIAYGHGSVFEILHHGETGFIVKNQDEAAAAIRQLPHLDRSRCRAVFEERFSARRMAEDYVKIYRALLLERDRTRSAPHDGDSRLAPVGG